MTPALFTKQMAESKFTHRSDADLVLQLQAKTFHEKVSNCEEVLLHDLNKAEFAKFVDALPYYTSLKVLRLRNFRYTTAAAKAFGKARRGFDLGTMYQVRDACYGLGKRI